MFEKVWLFIKNRWKQAQVNANLQKTEELKQRVHDSKYIDPVNAQTNRVILQPIKQHNHRAKTVQRTQVKALVATPARVPAKKTAEKKASLKKTGESKKVFDQKKLEQILLQYQNKYSIKGLEEKHIKILYTVARYDYKSVSELKRSVKYNNQNPEQTLENDLGKLVALNLVSEEKKLSKKNKAISIELSLTEMGKSLIEEIYPEIIAIKRKIREQADIQEQQQTISFSDNDLVDVLDSKE